MIVCVCEEAKHGCEKTCPKGRLIEPDQIYKAPWIKYYHMGHIKALKRKAIREMREG